MMDAIQIDDEDASGANVLQKKQELLCYIGMVSPDREYLNASNFHFAADKESAAFNVVPMISPEALNQSSITPIQPKINGNHGHSMMITPQTSPTTPTKNDFQDSCSLTPLGSPFISSRALFDSELASIKKKDCALHDRIERMGALFDVSLIRSFHGELSFGDWDEGDEDGVRITDLISDQNENDKFTTPKIAAKNSREQQLLPLVAELQSHLKEAASRCLINVGEPKISPSAILLRLNREREHLFRSTGNLWNRFQEIATPDHATKSAPRLSSSFTHKDLLGFDNMTRGELISLVTKLYCRLERTTSERDAIIVERDCLIEENKRISASKNCNQTETAQIPSDTQTSTIESERRSTQAAPERTIDLVVSSTNPQHPIDSEPFAKTNNYEEQIRNLKWENEHLKSQLEVNQSIFYTPNMSRVDTSVLSTPGCIEFAGPVDLDNLFKSCSIKKNSTQFKQCSPSVQNNFLRESSKQDAIQSRVLHETAICELNQASSLLLLLESSKASLLACKQAAEQAHNNFEHQAKCLAKQLHEAKFELELSEVKVDVTGSTIESLRDKVDSLEREKAIICTKLDLTDHKLTHAKFELALIAEEQIKQEEKIKKLFSDANAQDKEQD